MKYKHSTTNNLMHKHTKKTTTEQLLNCLILLKSKTGLGFFTTIWITAKREYIQINKTDKALTKSKTKISKSGI